MTWHGTVERACLWCGASFRVSPHYVRIGRAKYCSRACSNARQARQRRDQAAARFDALLRREPNGCLVWTGLVDKDGYGIVGQTRAHRVAYERAYGPIPCGLFVCHQCDNPPCCEPSHLFLGTVGDNVRDAQTKGRLHIPHRLSQHGAANPSARLTERQVVAIRSSAANGRPQTALAAEYRVGQTTISLIVRRQTWRHLEDVPA